MADPTDWRTIDELARLVGCYCWTEHRLFEVGGVWAGVSCGDSSGAEVQVWCAALSRRHGELARSWAARLPVRAGIDASAFVSPPSNRLAAAFDALAALDPGAGVGVLAGPVLEGLDGLYARHLASVSPVREGPVAEVLVAARGVLAGERSSREGLLRGMQALPELQETFQRTFEEIGVLPAVRPS